MANFCDIAVKPANIADKPQNIAVKPTYNYKFFLKKEILKWE